MKGEAMNALVAIGTPAARSLLQELARRRTWLWARNERRLKAMAELALSKFENRSVRTSGESS
jgi:hypothetical protein